MTDRYIVEKRPPAKEADAQSALMEFGWTNLIKFNGATTTEVRMVPSESE